MANKIEITITDRGTVRTYEKRLKKAAKTTDRFRIKTVGLTRAVGAFRNKLLLVSFATAAVAATLGKLVKSAGDAQEVISKFEAVFKEQAAASRVFAVDLANAVGRSETEMLSFLSTLQDTFVPMGFARDKAAELSEQLVTLALDVASFNDKADADVIRDFQSALVGSTETVRKYGIVITEAGLKQEALDSGLIRTARTLTEQEKIQLRLNLIMKGTTDAQGDAIRTMGSFNNQLKAAGSSAKDLAIELGNKLLPVATSLVSTFTELTSSLTGLLREQKFDLQATLDQKRALVELNETRLVMLNLNIKTRESLGLSTEALEAQQFGTRAVIEIIEIQITTLEGVTDALEGTTDETDNLTRSIKDQIEGWAEMFRVMNRGASELPDVSEAMRDTESRVRNLTGNVGGLVDITSTVAGAFAVAFSPPSESGRALQQFLISTINLFEGVIIASAAMNAALTAAFLPFVGPGSIATALIALEGAKAAVRSQKFAHGTNFAPGGLALVGEQGPELVNLPRGAQVFSNTDSRNIINNSGPQTIIIQIAGRMVATVLAPDLVRAAKLGQNELVIQA